MCFKKVKTEYVAYEDYEDNEGNGIRFNYDGTMTIVFSEAKVRNEEGKLTISKEDVELIRHKLSNCVDD